MKSPVTDDMIQYLAEMTLKVLPNNYKNIAYSHPSPPGSPNDPKHTHTHIPTTTNIVSFKNFSLLD